MKTGLIKQEKTTDIWFDEKAPFLYPQHRLKEAFACIQSLLSGDLPERTTSPTG